MTITRKRVGALLGSGFRWLLVVVLGLVFASFMLVLPLRWVDPPTTAFMLQDSSGRRPLLYDWTDFDNLGSATALAVVAAEDQKFVQHSGFDLASIRDAIDASAAGTRVRGASTISQQVTKNLFLWSGRNFIRKGLEAWLTVVLELCLPKRRILEIYLNVAEFGPGIYGVAAASQAYFDKEPASLSDAEAALLAAVLPNPIRMRVERPSGYVYSRQQWIMTQMSRLRRENWIATL